MSSFAHVRCLVDFLSASEDDGLEANDRKTESIFRLGRKVGCCEDGNELLAFTKCREFVDS